MASSCESLDIKQSQNNLLTFMHVCMSLRSEGSQHETVETSLQPETIQDPVRPLFSETRRTPRRTYADIISGYA